jgi:hypothetical protein
MVAGKPELSTRTEKLFSAFLLAAGSRFEE